MNGKCYKCRQTFDGDDLLPLFSSYICRNCMASFINQPAFPVERINKIKQLMINIINIIKRWFR